MAHPAEPTRVTMCSNHAGELAAPHVPCRPAGIPRPMALRPGNGAFSSDSEPDTEEPFC